MEYAYRRLSATDLGLMRDLLGLFAAAFNETETYLGAIPSDEYLSSLLSNPTFVALAAVDSGEVVGGLAAYVLEKFERDRREIYIYDLAVAEAHRRKGIERGLIHRLKSVAQELDAYVIYVQADPGDDPAIKLYESLGVKEDVFHFDIPVSDG